MVMMKLRAHFRPEFLNRLDEIVLFRPLTKLHIRHIIDLILADLNKRLSDKELMIRLSKEAENFIADNAYDPVYGARPLKRYMQKTVETIVARMILEDKVSTGDEISIVLEGDKLVARKENL